MKIILIYNANGTVLGEVQYIVGHFLGLTNCGACDITHSMAERGEKQEFKECKKRLPCPVDLLHTNEMPGIVASFIQEKNIKFPVALFEGKDGTLNILFTGVELDEMKGSVKTFEEQVMKHALLQ